MIKANFNSYSNNMQNQGGQPTLSARPTAISPSTSHTRPMRLRCALRRLVAVAALLLTSVLGAKAADYVIMAQSGSTWHFYAYTSTNNTTYRYATDATSFSYSSCVWNGSNGSSFRNSNNTSYGFYYRTNNNLQNRNNYDNFTIVGNRLHSSNYYVCYDNGWYTAQNNNTHYTNGVTEVLYSISGPTTEWVTATLTITGGVSSFDAPGNTNLSTSATYNPSYYTLTGKSTYYIVEGGTPSDTRPTQNATITWSPNNTSGWTLTNGVYDDGHVRINRTTGYVEYHTEYDDDTELVIKATATATGLTDKTNTYTISISAKKCKTPVISFNNSNSQVTITSETAGASIYYTVDGSAPTSSSTLYSAPFTRTTACTIKAIAIKSGMNNSGVGTYTLTKNATPTIAENGNNKIAISCATDGVTIHYTTDGSNPTTSSPTYSEPLGESASGLTIKAIAVKNGCITSEVGSGSVILACATPVITFTTIGNQGETTIECTTTGATIYYTTNNTDPNPSQVGGDYPTKIYNSADKPMVSDGTTVRALAKKEGLNNSAVAEKQWNMCTTEAPVITYTQSGTTATVIITSEPGSTIYYTTNGSNPDLNSTSGSSPITINNLGSCTVKAIAKNSTCQASATVSKEIILSGISSSGVVTLNDREDHSWSYYSDGTTPAQLHSLNPADVKITYYGNSPSGRTTMTSSSENGDNPTTFSETATGVKVGIDANASTFIYYKTLERENADGTGNCLYTTIPNPFSVRPTSTSGTNKYRGFYAWRIKSTSEGLSIVDKNGDAFPNDIIPAETELYFMTNKEYGNEVEFEALWAQAYVGNGYKSTVSYERNFVVGTTAINYPATYSALYPNGTTDGTIAATSVSGTSDPGGNRTLNYDTKFEYINLTGNRTYTANNHYLCFGRGISTANNAGTVQGISGNVADMSYTLRVESGQFSAFAFVRSSSATVSGRYLVKAIMGCDYDRATNTNNKLSVAANSTLFFSTSVTYSGSGNKDQKTFDCVFKSGSYQSQQWNGNTQSGQQGYQHVAYLGQNSAGNTYAGRRYVTVEGGEFSGMCGGRGVGSESTTYMTPEVITFDLRIKGGTFHGAVYGGAADNPSIGSRRFIITGGEIQSWIAGGCNGTGSTNGNGATNGNSYIYVGGTTLVGGDNAMTINDTNGGQVFGAGRGISGRASSVIYSHVAIADEAVVCNNNNTANIPVGGNVYGGSYNGTIATEANVYILGGTVEGGAFGGSYGNGTAIPTANVKMTGGLVKGGVYGGSNNTGTVNTVSMNIDGGQVGTGTGSGQTANIHGGGYGQNTIVSQNVELTLGTTNQTSPGVTVYGDVYGGSALGKVNGTTANTNYHTYVTLNKGTINGSLYGGALGDASTQANVYGPVQVKVYGGSVRKTDANGANGSGGVYGANNVNGAPQRSVEVDIYGTDDAPSANEYALFAVYGGGNAADYTYGNGYPTVKVHGCDNSIEYVYGGGNAAEVSATNVTIYGGNVIGNVFGGGNGISGTAANVTNNTNVNIYGGTILKVFGGSNKTGTIGGTITVNAESQTESGTNPITGTAFERCPMLVGELYGGGNMAASNAGSISIGCMNAGDMIDYVYGGANQANISGDISLTMTGGRIENLFGGNNTSGTISGGINVTVNWGSCSNSYLGNVFGGGNLASYSVPNDKTLQVNILNGTVSGNVYGGGKGKADDHSKGQIIGNPQVTIGDNVTAHQVTIGGSVFGGGDAGNVTGTPVVNVIDKCNTTITTGVYGGGNAADVTATDVTISGGTIGDVFGGGNGAVAAANVTNGTNVKIHGGTITRVFAGGNTSGTIGGATSVTIDHSSSCDQSISEVYGGGNMAAGKAGTITIQCGAENIGDVYGGANQADIGTSSNPSNIVLNINGGQINNVFGGNNTDGDIYGTITVNINKDASCNTFSLNNVYGGGNLAQYTGSPAVNILNGTVSGNVYGGGKGDPTASGDQKGVPGSVTGNPVVTIGDATRLNNNAIVAAVTGDVYGGGDAANVVGTPIVNVINKCNTTIGNVYGGGNAADVSGTDVNIDGGTITGMVFGGGHGDKNSNPQKQADVNGNVAVDITGGTIYKVFGGSNSKGNITGTVAVNIAKGNNSCEMHITEVYGGGNEAAGNAGTLTIGCTGDYETNGEGITDVYGGANAADINNNISLTIRGGHIDNVYGGNNSSGSISGTIAVNVNWDNTLTCDKYLGNVFGGGNLAQYTGSPTVNILNGTVSGNVYGGGKGDPTATGDQKGVPGSVTGSPVVTIGDNTSGHESYVATVTGDVYGGGDAANVAGTPQVNVVNKCNTTIGNVYGGGNAADVTGTDVNIDGGTITGMVFGGGHGDKNSNPQKQADVNGNVAVDITGGTIYKVFGGSNSKGNITGTVAVNIAKGNNSCEMHITEVYGGGNEAAGNAGTLTIGCTGDYETNGEGITDVYGGANAADINNNISLTIRGGHIDRVFGGNNSSGSISGTIAVEVNWDNTLTCNKYLGNVFGGGNLAAYTGSPTVTLTNGIVSHSVYGGGNEAGVGGSTVNINGGQVIDGVYGGCNTSGTVTGAIAVNINAGTLGTNSASLTSGIFGGGYGASTATNGNVTVTIGDVAGNYTPTIYGDIYGGSALGNVNNEATDITTVNFLNGTLHGNLYGGGLGRKATDAVGTEGQEGYQPAVTAIPAMVNGQVIVNVSNTTQTAAQCKIDLRDATIYGCNNTNGSPQDNVTVNIYKTAYNYSDYTNGDNYTAEDGAHPYYAIDQVFGGGNQADYLPQNGLASSEKKAVVHIYGCDNTVRRVFGGGNAAAATGIQTIIEGGRFDYVFGGGNGEVTAANIFLGGTDLKIHGGHINMLFGGSNAQGTITGQMGVLVDAVGACGSDMYIAEFFCGNNRANIGTQASPTNIVATIGCGTRFGDVYGGCNLADIYGNVTLTIEGGTMNNVYGGSKGDLASLGTGHADQAADINGNVTLNITGGSIGNAFGGSNINGNITGSIAVNVEKAANPCLWSLGNVYGASNKAAYTPTTPGSYPAVNIKNGEVTGNVFGGGLGATATVTSNPVVTIGDNTSGHESYVASVGGDVYGGGDAGSVVGTTQVNVVNKCNTTISGDVYGGGNAANVSGTDVNIDGGTIRGMVFGGGHGDKDATPDPISADVNGGVTVDVTGGTINKVFGGSNSKGNITGTVAVNVNKGATSCDMYIGEVYGGGNVAAGNAGTVTIGNTGTWTTGDANNKDHDHANTTNNRIGYELEGIGTVYGGAKAADIGTAQNNSNITLTINNGIVGNVFGGNNQSGTINGTITVNINRTSNVDNQWYIGSVYGGGNLASYTAPVATPNYPAVNIMNGTVSGSVFGGGYGASATVTANPQVTVSGGYITHDVFGGGEEAAVTGNPTVKLTGGSVDYVYGGGKQADIDGDNTVSIEVGTVRTDVYGGGMQGDVSGDVTVNISSSTYSGNANVVTINGSVYGGGALANTNTANNVANPPTPLKATVVNLYPGATINHDVYGGGRGQKADQTNNISAVEAVVYGNVTVNQYGSALTATYSSEGLAIGGRIFGGNNVNGTPKGHILVYVTKTTGANYSRPDAPYDPKDATNTTVTYNYDLAAVYGGGNQAEYWPDDVNNECAEVQIDGCNDVSIHSVYGGGNAASTPATKVKISGSYEIGYVFGGGNGAGTINNQPNPGANVGYHADGNSYGSGVASTNIYGGRIHYVYGGSNTRGDVRESAVAMLDEVNSCQLVVDGVYGGGREAYMSGEAKLELGCITSLNEIYGGSEKADIDNSVELTITSGHFNKVFGGNNKSGIISGSITVNIEQTGCIPITIDELYLGGNNAPYSVYGFDKTISYSHNVGTVANPEWVTHYKPNESGDNPYPDPKLNIRSFKSIGSVFGGGMGDYATMVGNPTVDINVTQGWVNGEYVGDNTSPYYANPQLLDDGVIGTVYGGGNAAQVIGNPSVKIGDKMGTSVHLSSLDDLYDKLDNAENNTITQGNIKIDKITNGVKYSNKNDGTKKLEVTTSQPVKGATITGNVYGGGNREDVTGHTDIQVGPTPLGGAPLMPAQQRTEQPAQTEPQAETEQPAAPAQPATQSTAQPAATQNAATESQQSRTVNPNRAN